jgi:hypothetical protein
MIDKDFMQQVRETKQSHERFMTAILASDVFPSLDTKNPLEHADIDDVPTRFGSSWFKYDVEGSKKVEVEEEKEEGRQRVFGMI